MQKAGERSLTCWAWHEWSSAGLREQSAAAVLTPLICPVRLVTHLPPAPARCSRFLQLLALCCYQCDLRSNVAFMLHVPLKWLASSLATRSWLRSVELSGNRVVRVRGTIWLYREKVSRTLPCCGPGSLGTLPDTDTC